MFNSTVCVHDVYVADNYAFTRCTIRYAHTLIAYGHSNK